MASVQQWIRIYKPNGTTHLVPASQKDFYLKQNAALLMGGDKRPDLLLQIEELTQEENLKIHEQVEKEAAAQSGEARKLRDAALAATIATGGNTSNNDLLAQVLAQNAELINELKNIKVKRNGKATIETE